VPRASCYTAATRGRRRVPHTCVAPGLTNYCVMRVHADSTARRDPAFTHLIAHFRAHADPMEMDCMKTRQTLGVVAFGVLCTFSLLHCSADPAPGEVGKPPPSNAPDAAGAADAPIGPVLPPPPPPPPGCKQAAKGPEPLDDACWIDPAFGVFVRPDGPKTGATGSLQAPFPNLNQALAALKAAPNADRTRVFLCAEAYADVTVEWVEGIAVYGYMDCRNLDAAGRWKADARKQATIQSESEIVSRAKNIARPTLIASVQLVGDSSGKGKSSIGLIAENSSGLTLRNCTIRTVKGKDGVDNVEPPQLSNQVPQMVGEEFIGPDGRPGRPESQCYAANLGFICDYQRRAPAGVNVCVGAPGFAGGPGGAGGLTTVYEWVKSSGGGPAQRCVFGTACFVPTSIASPTAGDGLVANTVTAQGATRAAPAQAGAMGANGTPGANAPLGSLTTNGYESTDGVAGTTGAPGQGGGGGSGYVYPADQGTNYGTFWKGYSGAGGGAGGCPGIAGGAGTSGGASIAILAFNSKLTLEKTTLVAAGGGRAGRGTVGSASTSGGSGKAGPGTSQSASGGAGGHAGVSGHGSAGPAYGIAWTGQKPVLKDSPEPSVPAPATGQPALSNADGNLVPAALAGDAQSVFAF
jgi:hypothetical protein